MAFRFAAAAFLIALSACARPVEPPPPSETRSSKASEAAAPAPVDILGRWAIVSLNGAPPRSGGSEADGRRTPYLAFTADTYGGNTGCNSFGGLGVLVEGRYYGARPMQTAIGCGDLTAQEGSITRLMSSAPRVTANADGTLTLDDGTRTATIRREASIAPLPPPGAPTPLAGTRWTIQAVDGVWLGWDAARRPTLLFEAGRWSLSGPCGERGGAWRQSGDRIEAAADPAPPSDCAPDEARISAQMAAAMASRPRFATGPNGEILIGGGGHWAVGERWRAPR